MAEIVRMPKLSDTMTEGVVVEWHKKVGDKVESGELLAEIETDKATMDFESFQDGILLYIGVEKGKAAAVDSILAILGEKGEEIQSLLDAEKKEVGSWQLAVGSQQPETRTQKPEPRDQKPETRNQKPETRDQNPEARTQKPEPRIKASPVAKKLAKKLGINITLIRGTGDGGRVTFIPNFLA